MADEKVTSSGDPKPEEHKTVPVHYIKANDFRVIHCDGVYGGPAPNGKWIHASLFSERLPIANQITYGLNEGGQLGEEVARVTRSGLVREIEVDVVMNTETAEALATWLLSKVKFIRDFEASRENGNNAERA
jgi:hypothetical protein